MKSLLGMVTLAMVLIGCNGRSPVLTGPTLTTSAIVSDLAITGLPTALEAGTRTRLRAFVTSSDGTDIDVTSDTLWSVDPPSVATIEAGNWLTGRAAGTAEVTGRYQKAIGRTLITITPSTAANGTPGAGSPGGSTSQTGSSNSQTGAPNNPLGPCLPEPLPSDNPPSPIPCPFPLPGAPK